MFGWINDCTECLVVSKFGARTWHEIKEKANCDVEDGGFLRYKYYADAVTVQLVVAASEVLGISVDDVLFAFGEYFVDYVKGNGYANVLECLGSNLRDWLANLNSLHDHLQASYPKGFVAPVFWSEDDEEFGSTPAGAASHAILVHYFSHRGSLLVPLVVGLIKKIAVVYFDIEINMDQLQLQDEEDGINNTTWRVTSVKPEEAQKLRGKKKKKKKANESSKFSRGDDETVSTSTTTKTNYEKTFKEGKTQAANLRVQELVKRAFYKEGCELFHGLTMEHYMYLVAKWMTDKIGNRWCFQIWTMQEDDPSSWPTLADLPVKLNPATIDSLHFGGKAPGTGRFPPDRSGRLQSFPPKIRLVNNTTKKALDIVIKKSADLTLEDSILNAPVVQEARLKEFPDLEDRIDRGEYEVQCVVWNVEKGNSYHTFALGDMKATSTLQLFELVPVTFDPIILSFQCVETVAVDEDEEDI